MCSPGYWRSFTASSFDRRESFYEVLGVTPQCSTAEIKRAFYHKAKDCHPDLHGSDPAMSARFRQLAEAYDVLSDEETRKQYNESEAFAEDGRPLGTESRWRPGDGWSAENMEGNRRWKEVMQDKEILQQAREEYIKELREDLKEAFNGALAGDFRNLIHLVKQHPGIVAGGIALALPVLAIFRSPAVALGTLQRLVLVEALITKIWLSFGLSWCMAMGLDLPGKIWVARVAAAKRSMERRRSRERATEAREKEEVRSKPFESANVPALMNVLAMYADTSGLSAATSGVPNVVYLDDSGSMIQFKQVPNGAFSLSAKYRWDNTCLQAGQKELIELAHYLEGSPTRVLKFGGLTVIDEVWEGGRRMMTVREEMLRTMLLETMRFENRSHLLPLLDAWDGSSQGTYMWHMIQHDIQGTYEPGTPIRVHLITDGVDTHSPGPLRGIAGMDALQKNLREEGYRIQWNIILLLFGAHEFPGLAAERYAELCSSSGGVFQMVSDGYRNSGADERLQLLLANHDENAARRRYKNHLLAARTGSGDDIQLPRQLGA